MTDTRRVRDISKALNENRKNSDYAVSLSHITNLLWYKLNRGFGSAVFPHNIDVIIKARTILSGFITQDIGSTYSDIRSKAAKGELSEEQVVARIIALKEKASLPEDLNADNIDDSLDFSENHFVQYEETFAQNDRIISERDNTIKGLLEKVSVLEGKVEQSNALNAEKQSIIDSQNRKIEEIARIKLIECKKKRCRRAKLLFVWSIIWKLVLVLLVLSAIWFLCKKNNWDFPTWLGITLSAVSIIISIIPILSNGVKKYKQKVSIIEKEK